MNPLLITLIVIAVIVLSPVIALFYGWIAGIYASSREATFRNRAVKLMGRNGQTDEFLIVSGDPALVGELYQVVVATTRRAEELAAQPPQPNGVSIADGK